jgi:Helix-turn-helix.
MGHTPEKPKRLAEKLLFIRTELGLSQNGMVRYLGLSDDRGKISEWETGRREPSLLVLLRYARRAGVAMELLVDDELDLPSPLPCQSNKGAKGKKS